MSERTLNRALTFWNAYCERDFINLKRKNNGDYECIMLDFGKNGDSLLGQETPFSITRRELLSYDYKSDDRFAPCAFETVKDALVSVLRNSELIEPTEPNKHRLRLIIRLIRDPSTAEPSYTIIVKTRNLIKDYAEKKTQKDQVIGQLRDLQKDRDDNFEILCQTVLKYLDTGIFNVEQAANLLYANTSTSDIRHIVILRVLLETVPNCEISVEKTCRFLEELLPGRKDYELMVESGKVASVHTERDILLKALSMCPSDKRITSQLVRILDNHENEDLFTVIEAISSLGFHNDKSCISHLVECLGRDDMARYRGSLEEALQLLCSGSTLILKAVFDMDLSKYTDEELEELETNQGRESKIEQEYWCEKEKTLPVTPADWLRQDAESVFWKKRMRCALPDKDVRISPNLQNVLRNDEVLTVRISAGGPESIGT